MRICDLLTSSNTALYECFLFLLKNFIFVSYEFLELLYESFSSLLKNFIFVSYEFLELDSRYIYISYNKIFSSPINGFCFSDNTVFFTESCQILCSYKYILFCKFKSI